MFKNVLPEQVGISSKYIENYLRVLQNNHIPVHSIAMARGNDIFFEHYVEPFHEDFCHRIYSCTKSFVALGIGFLVQDGLLSLDDTMQKLFPKETKQVTDPGLLNQTVRNMLMMSTVMGSYNWFANHQGDRVDFYFRNPTIENRIPGKTWFYDSTGSFVLCALIERLSGMDFMSYLRSKFLDEIGFSKEARCLKCPGGHSWGDSALLCKLRDFLCVARFILNGGSWNGKQLLNADYLREATSFQIDNTKPDSLICEQQGYGYKFWKLYGQAFAMFGMGSQFLVCEPEKDLIFAIHCDTQGISNSNGCILDTFFDLIVPNVGEPLPASPAADALAQYAKTMRLAEAKGRPWSPIADKINGVSYQLEENKMGITQFAFAFEAQKGTFTYTNATGRKVIEFGKTGYGNQFGLFPEEGYSKEVGGVSEPGHKYKCAASAGWKSDNTLSLFVQIIGDYFGNLTADFTFEGDRVKVKFTKSAEDFLKTYAGEAQGHKA